MNATLHVCIVNYAYDPRDVHARSLLERYGQLTGWAEGLAQAGAGVTVFQRFAKDMRIDRNCVSYRFIADDYGSRPRIWQMPMRLAQTLSDHATEQVAAGRPVVVHVNGLIFPLQTALLRRLLPVETAMVVQHHAEQPGRLYRRLAARLGLREVDGFLFTNHRLALPWIDRGIVPAAAVHEVMECSSHLRPMNRAQARRQSGMDGNPILLWTGNLTEQKDPLTVLHGFATVHRRLPEAQLYMAYQTTDILDAVRQTIDTHVGLNSAVTLLGYIPYGKIGSYYNSADLFVQGSRYGEGSGIALLDALACGVVPVVTDLPAFRTITANHTLGALWSPGDAQAFAAAVLQVAQQPLCELSAQGRSYFENNWTFAAIGRAALRAYGTAHAIRLENRSRP